MIGLTVARNSSGDDLITSATSETCRPVMVVPLMSRISSPVCECVCVCVCTEMRVSAACEWR